MFQLQDTSLLWVRLDHGGHRRVHRDYTHSQFVLEFISALMTLTPTPLIVFGINFKSVIGNCFWDQFPGFKAICISPPLLLDVPSLWDYTYNPEITLTLWNSFRINFPKLHLHFMLLSSYECNLGAPRGTDLAISPRVKRFDVFRPWCP